MIPIEVPQERLITVEARLAGTIPNGASRVRETTDVAAPAAMAYIVLGTIAWVFLIVRCLACCIVDIYTAVRAGFIGHFGRLSDVLG